MKSSLYNVEGFRREARRKLPRAIFDFVDGGAEDEITLRANRQAFESLRLVPRVLAGSGRVDLSTDLCGQPLSMPLMLSPTGSAGFSHPDGELGAAVAANRQGVLSFMAMAATYTVEEIAEASSPPPWFQLAPLGGREYYLAMVARVATLGFPGLCVTLDTDVIGRRERDLANGFVVPPTLGGRNIVDVARRPGWALGVLRHRRVVMKAFSETDKPGLFSVLGKATAAAAAFGGSLSPFERDDLRAIRECWNGPLAVKGILSPEDAALAVELGADVVIVSNHGGRQLDGAITSLEALPAVVDAVGGKAAVVLDSGVRRGSDVVKALCLGATACMIGRPWLYGLAAGGREGVEAVLSGFRKEIEVTMGLLGVHEVDKLDHSFLAPAGIPALPGGSRLGVNSSTTRIPQ